MKLPILTLAALTLVTQTAFAADVTVKVSHDALSPAEVTVNVGDTVIFENQVNMPGGHTLLADGKKFKSPPLATPGSMWKHTFSEVGRYPYSIIEHTWATGVITVK